MSEPLEWRDEEVELLQKHLAKFQSGNLKNFFARLRANGYQSLYRFRNGVSWNKEERRFFMNLTSAAWVSLPTMIGEGGINITDQLFQQKAVDPVGFSQIEAILFHELVHAFVKNDSKLIEEFYHVIEFDKVWKQADGMAADIQMSRQLIAAYSHMGDWNRAYIEQKEAGRRLGLPSLYALENISEALADVATYVYLDPTSAEYIATPVREWVLKNILN
ncbi:MAG: hypothetical protein AB7F59_09055 [Bdellovibrionales bacterium]